MTYRQYRAWNRYLGRSWNRPTRTDHYLMQIACEVRRVLAKKASSIRMKDFELKFQGKKKPTPPRSNSSTSVSSSSSPASPPSSSPASSSLTVEQAAAMSKARWFGLTGFRPKIAANTSTVTAE